MKLVTQPGHLTLPPAPSSRAASSGRAGGAFQVTGGSTRKRESTRHANELEQNF